MIQGWRLFASIRPDAEAGALIVIAARRGTGADKSVNY